MILIHDETHTLSEGGGGMTRRRNLKPDAVVLGKTIGAGIPADCPPMIGSFMGLQIVEAYRKATDCSYQQLFNEHDASKILRLSGYNPVK